MAAPDGNECELEETVPAEAREVFGAEVDRAARFAAFLRGHGMERGLIGPREVDRLWDRHLLNSAVLSELIPRDATVIDVGSGGGFPGIPLAIAREDIAITLVEPMARRTAWLVEAVELLELDNVTVVRGRAEDVADATPKSDVVTARAVAPLAKLARWCLPLAKAGGHLLAIKGASAGDEIDRDRYAVRKAGGEGLSVEQCGVGLLQVPTTVVSIRKVRRPPQRR